MVVYCRLLSCGSHCVLNSGGTGPKHVTLELLKVDLFVARRRVACSQAVKYRILRVGRYRRFKLQIQVDLPLVIFHRRLVFIFAKPISVSIFAISEDHLTGRKNLGSRAIVALLLEVQVVDYTFASGWTRKLYLRVFVWENTLETGRLARRTGVLTSASAFASAAFGCSMSSSHRT